MPALMSLFSERFICYSQKEAIYPPSSELPQYISWIIDIDISIYFIPAYKYKHFENKYDYYIVSIY